MKIVITNHEFRAHFPARINYLYKVAKETGHELKIIELFGKSICYEFSNNIHDNPDWEILFPNIKNGTLPTSVIEKKLVKRLDEINPDVVMSGMSNFPVGIIAQRWAKKNNKGIVQFGNALKTTFKRGWLANTLKRMMFRNVDAYFCPAPAWNESMIFWGYKKEEIFYGLNVANNHDWYGVVENVHFKDLPNEYFLTCGRQVAMKNLPEFLRCYLEYRKRGGKVPLVMVGEGVVHNELIQIANNSPWITFLPFLSHNEMREVFLQARALFLPSFKEETWGIVANEAMAAGVVVAASQECGCSTTIIKPGYNAFMFDPYDKSQIIETMFQIERLNISELKQLQDNGRKIIADWGVERFAQGALDACEYAFNNKKKIRSFLDRILIHFWQGRMNTTNQ